MGTIKCIKCNTIMEITKLKCKKNSFEYYGLKCNNCGLTAVTLDQMVEYSNKFKESIKNGKE